MTDNEGIKKIMETPDLDKMIRQKLYRKRMDRKGSIHKILTGDLVAGLLPDGELAIGFSLCHKNKDRYDFIDEGKKRVPGFGKKLAVYRAVKWQNAMPGEVKIPPSIAGELFQFLERCQRYFKDKFAPMDITEEELKMLLGEMQKGNIKV